MMRLALALALVPLAAAIACPKGSPGEPTGSFRFEERVRLTRLLGLAEALNLDDVEAAKMRDLMAKYDARCQAQRRRHYSLAQSVRRIANGEPAAPVQANAAIRNLFDLEAEVHQVHREMFDEISKGLSPQQRARAAVFLASFRERFGVVGGMHEPRSIRTPGN